MTCGRCRESGHNRTTCPKSEHLPQAPPAELLRVLIDPMHALTLVTEGKTAEALANATRQIGELNRDGLGHLACSDILIALAELELRSRQIPAAIENVRSTRMSVESAKAALAAARHEHARSEAEILIALGYHEKAEALGFPLLHERTS